MNSTKPQWLQETAWHPIDPICNAEIMQLTSRPAIATNIYCEDPAISPDGHFAIFRSAVCEANAPAELWVCDSNTGRLTLIDHDASWSGAAPQAYGAKLFYPRFFDSHWELRELTYATLEVRTLFKFDSLANRYGHLGSASPDGRYITSGRRGSDDMNHVFVVDVTNGTETTIASAPDLINPHPRFDRMQGDWVLVQHNRGQTLAGLAKLSPGGDRLGPTLFLCKRDGSEKHELPIARPAIAQSVSGHEAWLYNQPAFLYSSSPLDPPFDDGERCGNLLLYRLGEAQPRVVADAPDLYFGHVSTSACGRYWCCDAWPWRHDGSDACRSAPLIYIGNIKTKRFAPLCEVGGYWPRYENGHCHPYLATDNRHVIFTSTRTGLPQVYRATLPQDFLAALD